MVQIELFPKKGRGGKRRGAGRPAKGVRSSERHETREPVRASWPVHVTLRVRGGLYLRKHRIWRAIAKASRAVTSGTVVHASVQHDHIHLIAEAVDQYALAKAMHAFQVSAAHWINRAEKRSGRVFADRYHAHVLKTPSETRNAIRYVLSNWRKHGEDQHCTWAVDPFSSGYAFFDERAPSGYEPMATSPPRSWLLREGWQRAGAITPMERPG
ncbi:MAG TPA: transposase [Kofleriaceae bacterium]|jgi:REP element-mobilizing transposase RayT